MLETLNLDLKLEKAEYRRRRNDLRNRLHQLQRACHDAGLASITLFSGWDAAGRGATIKKLTERLEPRAFSLHVIREPRTSERLLPWMWRFWQTLPNYGEMAIYDRSWYSEVIKGHAQGSLSESEWLRACRDIRVFERALADDHHVVTKFFLHISAKEQKKRLNRIQDDPVESWRIGQGDWDRHEAYGDYRIAIEETLQSTESEWAPWVLVEAHDRYWARIRVFEGLVERLEMGLRARGHEVPTYETEEEMASARSEDLDG